MSSSNSKDHVVIKSSLKLKKGTLFKKKKKVDLREIDLTIKKPEEQSKKTDAELAFEKRQRDTAFERLSKKAAKSHKEKVEEFNKQMDSLTEFNDIQKVSWTK
ncbi:Protein of unknown function DUF1754 domain containing protein [Aphelenchoides bicaudatus]|nr:Protein of unknown function DUF1754 domain containing protein [Aphelenchoides bicaudatus]